jgi:NAD(P)-dependent dehydrogenase (short-subunit alcohol dehydrogenase family)
MAEDTKRTALVTGGNRGLGLETCRQLVHLGHAVILTARDAADGAAAAKVLGADFHALDVTDPASIAALADWLRATHRSVDVLVNNAAVALDGFNAEVARKTIDANVYGPLRVTEAVLPFMPDGGTIVMVSSGVGELSGLAGPIRRELTDQNLTTAKLMALMERFVGDVTDQRHREAGWPSSAYRLSKAGLNALTRLLAAELAPRRIRVNAVCPGWVRTRMGGQSATRGIVEGTKSILWAATLPADGPTGGFFRDGRSIPW